MALKAGRYGLKKKMLEKLLSLPGIKSIGEGLYLNASTGELSATGGGGGGTTVVANPEGAATDDLAKLQVGETIYGIPEGTDVEANPSGSATDNLTKLKVGNDIYGVLDFDSLNYSTQGLTFTPGECEYLAGGYIKIGKLVFVNIRFKVTHQDGVCTVPGFPSYTNRTAYNKVLVISSYVGTTGINNAYIASNGTLAIPAAVTVGSEFVFNGVYLAD